MKHFIMTFVAFPSKKLGFLFFYLEKVIFQKVEADTHLKVNVISHLVLARWQSPPVNL